MQHNNPSCYTLRFCQDVNANKQKYNTIIGPMEMGNIMSRIGFEFIHGLLLYYLSSLLATFLNERSVHKTMFCNCKSFKWFPSISHLMLIDIYIQNVLTFYTQAGQVDRQNLILNLGNVMVAVHREILLLEQTLNSHFLSFQYTNHYTTYSY